MRVSWLMRRYGCTARNKQTDAKGTIVADEKPFQRIVDKLASGEDVTIQTIEELRAEAVAVATGNDVERIASANELIDLIDSLT
jgi:hypothetical protein